MHTIGERSTGILVRYLPLLTLSTAVLCGGCGGGGDDIEKLPLYPASGTVKMDGEPLGPVTLRFDPPADVEGQSRGFVADADENGKFDFVTTYEMGDGAPAGTYTVTVFSSVGGASKPFPALYESNTRSPLKVVISDITGEGANSLNIELDSSAGAPSDNPTTGHLTEEQFRPGLIEK